MERKHLLLVLLMSLALPLAMWGQEELTVNSDGTFNNPYLPIVGEAINGDGGLFQSEFIIPSTELTSMNGKSVSVMSFYVASPSPNTWGDAQFNVFLKEVDYTTLEAFSGTEGATIVYSGPLDATGSAMDVFFDNTYTYAGGNLLIGFYLTAAGTNGTATFVGKMMEGNTAFIGLQDNPETYTEIPCLPKITFSYSSSPISCYKPRNLNATVGSTSAVLDWNNGNEETSWQISYSTVSGNPEGGTLVAVTSHPHALSGLTNETTYYAYVRSNCGDGYSDWSSVCSFTPSNSLSLTVNEGGMYEGGFQVPIYSYFTNEGMSSQFIIPAVELADVMNGQITKLTFYNMSSEISWGDAEFNVYLGQMEASEFSGSAIKPWAEMTEVYSGALSVSNGMMEITLATPYNYGTDNLVVGFNQTTVGTQGSQYNDLWYGVSASGSNIGLYSFGYSYTSASAVPKTTIQYTQGTPPACVRPRNLQATVTSQAATLTWDKGLDETSWEISYSTTAGSPATGTIASVNTQSYTITGLTNGTAYYAYVRANCGGSYSDWSTVCAFTPTDVVPTVDLTVYNGTYTGSGVPIQSQFTNYGVESQYIIPAAYLSDVEYGQINSLTFYCNTASVSWGDAASFKVYLGETSLEHFSGTNIVSWNDLTEVYSGSLSVSDNTMVITFTTPYAYEGDNLVVGVKQTANGTSLTGISWYSVGDWDGNTALYGISIIGTYSPNYYLPKTTINYTPGTAPSCPKPKNLIASETDAHSTKLSWANGGDETSWILQYATDEGFTQNVVSTTITTNPYVLSDLTSDITYYARVKAHCGEGDESDWSNVCNFTPACPKPTNLCALNVGKASATMTWTNGGDESAWVLQYATDNAFTQNVVSVDVTSNPCSITGLTAETTYYARVKADCGNGDESAWSNVCSFTPSTDKITICGGLTTNEYVPVYGLYVDNYSKSQFIIPAATMGAELVNADITQISFYCDRASIDWGVAEFDVYFKEVTNTAFSSTSLDWTGMTVVYSGQLSVSNYMMTIELSEPYPYGGGNLMIGIKQTTSGTYKGSSWYGVETDYNSAIGGYEYSKGLSYWQFLPKTTFTYVKAQCAEPTNLTINNITSNSAVLGWTPGGEVSNWQVQYKKTSDADWSESIAVSGTASCTLGNLTPATEYEARVRTVCGADDYSDWVAAETFTTDCDYVALPYSHDFDSDATGHVAPTCWHFSDGTYPYIYEGSSAHSGNHYLQIKKNSDNAAILVLPEINTDEHPINTLQLTFWARASQSNYYYDYLYLGVMTDPDDVTTFQYVQGASTNLSTTTYKKFELYFDNWSGEGKYIALRYSGTTTYYIDDIELSVAPTCMAPLELSSNTTYAHEAYIRWKTRKANQLDYQVSYSTEQGFDPADGTIVDVHFDSPLSGTMYRDYQLTCLDAETTYYFYVRTKCGESEYSDWSADYSSFSTDWACPAPYINDIHPKHTVADIYWYGNEDDEWEFQYKESSSDEWITPADFSPIMGAELSLVYRLTGLTPDTEYDIRIRQHCGMYSCPEVDDGYSEWATDYFTTGSGCWEGEPWMCTSHLGTKAALNWRNDAEASRWQIRYRLESEEEYPEENIVTTDVLPEASLQKYVVTGLQPNSTYYWEVRGYCDETSQGEWSSEDYFFTRSTDGFITVNKTHPYYEDFEDGMPADWGRMNLYNYDMNHYDTWECVNATSSTWEALPATQCISSCRECMSWASTGSMILMPAIYIDENATSAVLSFWSKDAYNASDARGTKMIWVNGNYLSTEYTAFDYGNIYQNSSNANYWRQCFVNLDDYIGDTVIIAFDYVFAHNYNNYDWWVDNVRVEVFDNVFGGGSEVTEGNWDDPTMWGNGGSRSGGLPTADDNVLINAKVTIPEGFVAEANRIVLNLDTIAEVKYGNIFIADGGQLKVNDEVEVTMERAVIGYGRGGNGWYLIAPPVQEALKPESDSIADVLENSYDLYSFDGSYQGEEWRNYKQDEDGFTFENGFGYLFANSASVSPSFKGTVMPSNQTKSVDLDFAATTFGGWNLVGNPFTCDAYFQDGRDFYRMNEGGTALTLASGVIYPMEGVFVEADDEGQSVVFTTTEPTRGQGMNFSLRKANERSAEAIDRTRILFGEGPNLGHLDLMADPNRLYIPMDNKELAVVSTQPVGELPLNFEAAANGTYTLDFENETEGLMYCHLIDNLIGADVDLLQQPEYSFEARVSDYPSRFKVVFVTQEDGSSTGSETFAFNNNGNWIIANEGRATLQVVDVNGRILSNEQIEGCAETHINVSAGVYMIRLINGDNVKVQKVVVR